MTPVPCCGPITHTAMPRSARLVLAAGGRCSLGSVLPFGHQSTNPSLEETQRAFV